MSSVGVELEEPRNRRMREVGSWHRAVSAARKHLTLVMPESIARESVGSHPARYEIRYWVRLYEAETRKLGFDASLLWKQDRADLIGADLDRKPVSNVSPPFTQRNRGISRATVCERDRKLPSSMEKLIECPLAWEFQYISKKYAGDLALLPHGSQKLGILSHAVIERKLGGPNHSKPEEMQKRTEELFDELVPQMASPLLYPGWELDQECYRKTVGAPLRNLVNQIESSKLQAKAYEKECRSSNEKNEAFDYSDHDSHGAPRD